VRWGRLGLKTFYFELLFEERAVGTPTELEQKDAIAEFSDESRPRAATHAAPRRLITKISPLSSRVDKGTKETGPTWHPTSQPASQPAVQVSS